jgi:hypothetical protein
MTYICLRCGRERSDHDTNLVCESHDYLTALKAEEVEPGYAMSLLTCSDTKRPTEYSKLLRDNDWVIGHGAGYVSPDPAAEDAERREYLAPWWQMYLHQPETLFIIPGQGIVASYNGH